jgi:hypothetical protein
MEEFERLGGTFQVSGRRASLGHAAEPAEATGWIAENLSGLKGERPQLLCKHAAVANGRKGESQ